MADITVAKFGGSSLADAGQFRKVKSIVKNDPLRKFVVVSAPQGVTDLLFALRDGNGKSFEENYAEICKRFHSIVSGLGVVFDPTPDLNEIRFLAGMPKRDEMVSRGEYLCAKIVAQFLGFEFLDAAHFVKFNEAGEFDIATTRVAWCSLSVVPDKRYVVPGFYGSQSDGGIKLFSRNASDVSGAIVAACAGASVFEKWTNESGIRRADPNIVPDAELIDELTFREVRELTSRGTKILHSEVIFPLREAKIPIHIKNIDQPHLQGTRIVPNEQATPKPPGTVVGISSRKGYAVYEIEKAPMGIGYAASVLGVFAALKIDIAHLVDGVDEMGIVVHAQELKGKEGELCVRLRDVCKPDMLNIDHGIAILGVVGHWMDNTPGTAAKIFDALGRTGVSAEIIDQSRSQTNIVIGVADKDCDTAVRAIYDRMIRQK